MILIFFVGIKIQGLNWNRRLVANLDTDTYHNQLQENDKMLSFGWSMMIVSYKIWDLGNIIERFIVKAALYLNACAAAYLPESVIEWVLKCTDNQLKV